MAAWGGWNVLRTRCARLCARGTARGRVGTGQRIKPPRVVRWKLALLVWSAAAAALLLLGANRPPAHDTQPVAFERLKVGFTFSQRQAAYLDLPWRETFHAALDLSPRLVRLGAYWDEIERTPGRYDFSTLDWLIDSATERDLQVILTVGMKAPRWPEYYLPKWLRRQVRLGNGGQISDDERVRAHTRAFIRQVVERYRDRSVVAYWQVENEPLDPSGDPKWHIGADFLREEVELVRELDPHDRPIIVNMFVQPYPLGLFPPWRDAVQRRAETILGMADILGLDIYPSVGLRVAGLDLYLNWSRWTWERPVVDLQALAEQHGKEAWVIEAQAEPWEPSQIVYTDAHESRSVQPTLAVRTFERLHAAGFQHILLWGVEHWYMRLERHDDTSWWDMLGQIFRHAAGALDPAGQRAGCQPERAVYRRGSADLAQTPCTAGPARAPQGLDSKGPLW